MKTASTATAPAAYTNSVAAALTVAAMLGLAAGAKTAKAWDQQASAHADQRGAGSAATQRDFQLEGR